MATPSDSLDIFRRQLLDLTLRNPLLNHRPSKRRGFEVVDEDPAQVVQWFVEEGRPFTIHTAEASPEDAGDDDPSPEVGSDTVETVAALEDLPDFDEVDDPLPEEPNEDDPLPENPLDSLAVPYGDAECRRRLDATAYDARLHTQERGTGALYLVVGMLEWYESPDSEQLRRAPLILLPATLGRSSARARWRLTPADEDPGVNISLVAKLRDAFSLELPDDQEIDGWESADRWLAAVEAAVAEQGDGRWRVCRRAMCIGFFSFSRFLMWRDLDPALWPEDANPAEHPVVRGLLGAGFREPPSPLGAGDLDEERQQLGEFHEILDCDSSQADVIAQVMAGRNLVVQGPPGTGKSQTIANMLAEAASRGKTVLFVAEKMAALRVVANRLEQAGLGDLCLELHSDKASKKAVAAELARTLANGQPLAPAELAESAAALPEQRARLNGHARALAPDETTGRSVPELVGLCERARRLATGQDWPTVDGLGPLTPEAWSDLRERLAALVLAHTELGVLPQDHPWVDSRLQHLLPDERRRIDGLLAHAQTTLVQMTEACARLADSLGLEAPEAPADQSRQRGLAESVATRPDGAALALLQGSVAASVWQIDLAEPFSEREAQLEAWIALQGQWQARVLPEIWDQDLSQARAELASRDGSWFAWLSGAWRSAKRTVRGWCQPPLPASASDCLAVADAVLAGRRLLSDLDDEAQGLPALLASGSWRKQPEACAAALAWVRAARLQTDTLGSDDIQALCTADAAAVATADAACAVAEGAWNQAWLELAEAAALVDDDAVNCTRSFSRQSERLQAWREQLGALGPWAAWQRALGACADEGLAAARQGLADGSLATESLVPVIEASWARAQLHQRAEADPTLLDFDGAEHERRRGAFAASDLRSLEHHRYVIAEQHWLQVPPDVAYGTVGQLRAAASPGRRKLPPIRSLVARCGPALQRVKPILLMSPLAIAAYLPPGAVSVDLVVFDEASQVRPADALGALARSQQAVVVGDPMQMPPTSFFDQLTAHEDGDDDGFDEEMSDAQSILDLARARGMPEVMLRWHYRSRHESLIALSNRLFYDERLLIFPGPEQGSGLRFHHLPETVYDRGRSRSNVGEAQAIADLARQHFVDKPNRSLGLVALSVAQRNALLTAIEQARRADPAFDAWCESGPEPLFIKNLENVQGDERDHIIVSIGYGRPAEDAPVPQNFGPVNRQGGERRLNVLFTRSRYTCTIVANFTADDLRVGADSPRGVAVLRDFLAYAQTGRLAERERPLADATVDSPFEAEVIACLSASGYAVHGQVGCAGYRIDCAVLDPQAPGRYAIGIECDGATYHAARWARDRDRLRQQVLEALGWRIHRVWSTDWFHDRERAQARLLAAVASACAGAADSAPSSAPAPGQGLIRDDASPERPATAAAPYQTTVLDAGERYAEIDEVPDGVLDRVLVRVVDGEGPILRQALVERVVKAVYDRLSERRCAVVEARVEACIADERLAMDLDFLLIPDREIIPRDRRDLDDADIEAVHPAEIQIALALVRQDALGCTDDEAVRQAASLLGFQRLTPKVRSAIEKVS